MKTTFRLVMLILSSCLAFAQPYQPQVIWDRSGETDSSAYGTEIVPLGDQNNDGYEDWAVVAWGNLGYHGTQHGYVELFHGSTPPSQQPYHTLHIDTVQTLGEATSLGDVNGDGYVDWSLTIVQPSNFMEAVCLFWGGPTMNDTPDAIFREPASVGVKAIGDFNGDGYADLDFFDYSTNVHWMRYGGSPFDTTIDWLLYESPFGIDQSFPRAIGDFNGDGASDFLCFNPNNGQLDIFLGGAQSDTIPDYVWADMMQPIGGIRSLNGDAADEMLIGLGIYWGRDSLLPTSDAMLNFSCQGSAGVFTATAGDFNDDSYRDLLIWTPSCVDNPFGSLSLYLGHPWLYPNPAFFIDGNSPPLNLRGIYTAAGLGDVNGDSLDDFAIGAWNDTFGPWRGRCVIISGDDSLIASADEIRPEIPQKLSLSVYPNPFNAQTILSLEIPFGVEQIELSVVNVLGQTVSTRRIPVTPGRFEYRYDGRDLASGVYVLRVEAGKWRGMQKVVLLK